MKRILLLSALVCGSVRIAQSQDSQRTGADSAQTLSPVTVTATRRAESVLVTPLAVTIIGKADLENRRGYGLDEALHAVPGVFAASRYGASDVRLTIRGFGARGAGDRSNAGTSRGVRVLIDGIPETEPDGRTSFDLVDLAAAERVEIVRSNSSALYGNAAGGLVGLSTLRSVTGPFLAASQMSGSFGLLRSVVEGGGRVGSGTVNGTFTNTVQEGWRAHSDARRSLFNAAYASLPASRTDVGLFLAFANDLFHIPGPLTRAQADANPRAANATYAARDERRYNRVGRIGITLDQGLGSASSLAAMLFVNPKVLQRSERGTFRDFNRYHFGGNAMFKIDSRITDRIRGATLFGADAAHQDGTILFYSLTPAGKRGTELRDNKAEGATNTGVFAQEEIYIGESWKVQLGARYDDIRYDYRNFITPKINAAKSFQRVSPKIGTSFVFAPGHSLYASLGGGIEAPAGNETDPAGTFGQDTVVAINPLLDAIRSTTYEAGTKNFVPLSGRALSLLSYEAAVYRTEVQNEIIPYRGGRFYFTAGKVRREGLELGGGLAGPNGLSMRGSLTLSRNHYIKYIVDSVHYGRAGFTANYAGNEVAGTPKMFWGLSLGRDIPVGIPLGARIEMRGVGDYFLDDANAVKVPGYQTVDFTLTLGQLTGVGSGLSFGGFVTVANVLDKKFIGSAYTNPDVVAGAPVAYEPGAPRTVAVSVRVSRGR